MKLMSIAFVLFAASVAFAQTNSGAANRSVGASGPDHTFVMKAAHGGLAEVEMGRLAQERGSSAKVKDFGKRMVDDHTRLNNDLEKVAKDKGITLPTAPDAKETAAKDRLSKLSGAAFDRAYMADMVRDHKEDVAEFQKEADHGGDADIKALASKALPTLQEHLKMAEETSKEVGSR